MGQWNKIKIGEKSAAQKKGTSKGFSKALAEGCHACADSRGPRGSKRKQKDGSLELNHINNYLKCKWIEQLNAKIYNLNKKLDTAMRYLQETL